MFGFDFSFQRIQSVTHVVLRKLQTLCLADFSFQKIQRDSRLQVSKSKEEIPSPSRANPSFKGFLMKEFEL
jgi:hypothetical protein